MREAKGTRLTTQEGDLVGIGGKRPLGLWEGRGCILATDVY